MELLATGKPVQHLAGELRIGASLLCSWRAGARECAGASASGRRSEADGLRLLRLEHARLQVENDILKKTAVILGTGAQAGSVK
ncbi:MAG: hypothetical protein JWM59_1742 [Verrucomicrobiales bacterium]|nr:hypothetical protein [Verrucomicrobiales bacterium]